MPRGRPPKIQAATPAVLHFFAKAKKRVFHLPDLSKILAENRDVWNLSASTTPEKLVELLSTKGDLREIQITPSDAYPNARKYIRYSWGPISPFSVGLSMRKGSYLSHGTAVFLRGLSDQLPRRIIYVNQEQSPKPQPDPASLTQQSIAKAFSRKQRQSTFVYHCQESDFLILSGKNTGELEVGTLQVGERSSRSPRLREPSSTSPFGRSMRVVCSRWPRRLSWRSPALRSTSWWPC